eukprot:TRINITY_DN670_c0_g1_i1.p1 TRINITY_DN670_c0_g1~~TRINITY_DN670_c0_g1_i1.p1  ORF type:complete len:568 (+),score=187.25 TRINITY_DN670_c0_g1_i1:227-1930(+)
MKLLKGIFICVFLFVLIIKAEEHEPIKRNIEGNEIKKTDEYAIQVNEGVDVNKLAQEHGFKNMGRIGNLDYFLFKKLKTKESFPSLKNSEAIKFMERQVLKRRYKRIEVADPLFAQQWHLQNNVAISIKPMEMWDQGITGANVSIAVVDDGLEVNNNDIHTNYFAEGSWDFNYNDNDPSPIAADSHGTSAAGCAGAPLNSVCGAGVAPNAKLSGIRLIALDTTDSLEARALSFKTELNHIFTNSWGPFDDGKRYEGAGPLLRAAMEQSVKEGRGGKGTIYVWAGGNGRRANDNCNYDGYANQRYTIAIGAIGNNGVVSYYSEPCASLVAVAPSSGGTQGITTCDLNGSRGSSPNDCTNRFGGTSAAAPLAAGVIALMLQANPNLSWRDVQHVLAKSSLVVDANNADWWTNAGGYKHNHDYGFGLVSATNAVNFAKSWVSVPAYETFVLHNSNIQPINSSSQLVVSFNGSDTNSTIDFIEHIEITLRLTHAQKGNLAISLKNAFGTTSKLSTFHADTTAFPAGGWTYSTVRHWGEAVGQNWDLIFESRSLFPGSFSSADIKFYGYKRI